MTLTPWKSDIPAGRDIYLQISKIDRTDSDNPIEISIFATRKFIDEVSQLTYGKQTRFLNSLETVILGLQDSPFLDQEGALLFGSHLDINLTTIGRIVEPNIAICYISTLNEEIRLPQLNEIPPDVHLLPSFKFIGLNESPINISCRLFKGRMGISLQSNPNSGEENVSPL